MVDRDQIRKTLRKRLLTVSTLPPANMRAWENRDFNPPEPKDGVIWIRETLIPADERLSALLMLEFDGYVQYDVFCPRGRGTEAAEALAKAIGDVFKPGISLTDPARVHIIRTVALQGVAEPVWYGIPVQVIVKAFVPKG